MIKRLTALAAAWLSLGAMQAPAPPPPAAKIQLWRLGCGEFVIKQYGAFFSDTFQYPAGPKNIVGSCYLIRHGNRYMLWDTGLTDALVGKDFDNPAQTLRVKRSLVDQLAQIGVKPAQIELLGISHWHFDHTGQAPRFPQATLLMGKGDLDLLRGTPSPDEDSSKALAHWLTGGGKSEPQTADKDVFGDGRVVMLKLPGHTPGHYALLVRLASGPVLLSGDQYHFTEQVKNRGVPPFNHDRADTLASSDRFDRIAANLKAKVIIQHEPADVSKLPAFPKAAE
ncbi:MAG TPA: N-acyl homoserine lactonase family protein [Allosphingosinicella sp.]|jgi:glyoxylase-like metal-dependent hydrolase (beta-lactamase superfamily II)|nr:N-acyl homoserine lactonase family protein [Allosphingosinicella sp.]